MLGRADEEDPVRYECVEIGENVFPDYLYASIDRALGWMPVDLESSLFGDLIAEDQPGLLMGLKAKLKEETK